jgi:hypothetical protein
MKTKNDVIGLIESWQLQADMDFKIIDGMMVALGQGMTYEQAHSYWEIIEKRREEYIADPEKAWAVLRCPVWALAVIEETE